jgi:hypothetical protein
MSVEFIGVGDLHFDKLTNLVPSANRWVRDELCTALDWALRNGVNKVMQYGDVCERAVMSYDAHLQLWKALFDRKYRDMEFHFILGNHDVSEKGVHSMQLLEKFAQEHRKNLHVYTEPQTVKLDGVPIRMLPWPCVETVEDQLNVFHSQVKGATGDNGHAVRSDLESDHLILSGHLHTPHKVRNTHFSGTLYQTNFGESLPKSFHHVVARKSGSSVKAVVKSVPHDPRLKLINLEVYSRKDLTKIDKNPRHLYKLFVQSGVDLDPKDLELENVVRMNVFTTKGELREMQLEQEMDEHADATAAIQPEQDLHKFLVQAKVSRKLRDRCVELHNQHTGDLNETRINRKSDKGTVRSK